MPSRNKARQAPKGGALSARELEILALVASGLSTADIAARLGISPATIKAHLTSIFRKTGTTNRVQAARHYLDTLRPGAALEQGGRSARRRGRGARLTQRELQVLELIGAGETTDAISRKLGLSEGTVKTHLTKIYEKTGSRNRVQAARYYVRHYGTAGAARLSTLEDDIADIKARLRELQPALEEAERLQQALEALEAARRALDG